MSNKRAYKGQTKQTFKLYEIKSLLSLNSMFKTVSSLTTRQQRYLHVYETDSFRICNKLVNRMFFVSTAMAMAY